MGTIILILVVMFLFYNVYLFTVSRDADYQNIVIRSQQMDADRAAEKLSIFNAVKTGGSGFPIVVTCTLQNDGSVPIQVVRLWLKDFTTPSITAVNASLLSQNVVIQPGARTNQNFTVTAQGALSVDTFILTLITSRGTSAVAFIS
jgi:hypothetical protein